MIGVYFLMKMTDTEIYLVFLFYALNVKKILKKRIKQ